MKTGIELSNALNALLSDEDLTNEKLREASEGLLPNIADYLNGVGNTDGVSLILRERKEQLEKHCRTIQSDLEINKAWQLSTVASVLANQSFRSNRQRLTLMPDNWDDLACLKMIQKPYKERLIIAGALIAAEIDRLEALAEKEKEVAENADGGS